ncbi:MAG: tRNA (adenosine(37)-N6)-threonylcarbamoyltransferase complex dimerization subunit type 1 TsaB [Balneolaceae bacterium]|nr:tRNA (adenosine(37)-N6)-threonylcarbamoyltransferase complex dimerization subunit type 1 TsaB [Balneolaceae bacterium]MBO6547682.1 tRNA (adenosine(37)-N6)-threonylcarbamoyltransferase complex dimerization subunit type 1 TsaB [Balneolaceae bacterium]MBO6648193.1 tRNA (adenosine(37)-N6)-threonylcarbamoyltransferase complex dimerization subunit type 1 TsaB [Balneolaceae bacterium]
MILAYETATNVCSVSFQDGDGNISEKRIKGRGVHSDNVFLFTQEFMQQYDFKINDLDAVLVSNGPGSYTGLRIAASALKGILFETEVPLYTANTLASFAMESDYKGGVIHSIIDARRTHVYCQSFELGDKLIKKSELGIVEIADFQKSIQTGDCIIGTGIDRLNQELLKDVCICDDSKVTANSLFKLYQLPNSKEFCMKTNPEELNPNYISSGQVNNSNSN